MKLKKYVTLAAVAATALFFTACEKDDDDMASDEIETTFALSANQAIAYNINEDAIQVVSEAAIDRNLMGNRPLDGTGTNNTLSCATLTVAPASGFPKTLTIDFGSGCTSTNGVNRNGIVTAVLSDSLRRPGSTVVVTFNNYMVNGYKSEGTLTLTNTTTGGVPGWQRKVENGKITSAAGVYWMHAGTQNMTQTGGIGTATVLDDVFSITGTDSVTSSGGSMRKSTIQEALQKKVACENVDKGKIRTEGPSHFAVIDFGDGTCDRLATISIDGWATRTILLRQ